MATSQKLHYSLILLTFFTYLLQVHATNTTTTTIRRKPLAKIYFQSVSPASLYINGEELLNLDQQWQATVVEYALKTGDVLAVETKGTNRFSWGVLVSIFVNGEQFNSNHTNWRSVNKKSVPSSTGNAWMQPEFDACDWLYADIRSTDTNLPDVFPPETSDAFPIWPGDADNFDTALFRYRHGGEVCKQHANDVIHFASGDSAELFVNGRRLSNLDTGLQKRSVRTRLTPGDIISIISQNDDWDFYAIAAIETGGKVITTGNNEWRARAEKSLSSSERNSWQSASFKPCSWPAEDVKSFADAPEFFDKFGANYVWAGDADWNERVYIRYRIGGESCPAFKHSIYWSADDSAKLFINGKQVSSSKHRSVNDPLKRVPVTLNSRDVVAVEASNEEYDYGVIVAIDLGSKVITTGTGEWSGTRSNKAKDVFRTWNTNAFKPCDWPAADTVNTDISFELPSRVPHTIQRVWAGDGRRKDTILLRHRIDGEDCPAKSHSIYYSADDSASLYVNNKKISYGDRALLKRVPVLLKKGDIVGLQVKNKLYGYGVFVGIDMGNTVSYTGSLTGEWRASRKKTLSKADRKTWKNKDFDMCDWPAEDILSTENVDYEIPSKLLKARMVWAGNAKPKDSLFLRYEVGGNSCPALKHEIYYSTQTSGRLFVNGKQISSYSSFFTKTVPVLLKPDDVIGIEATHVQYNRGVIAGINLGTSNFYPTGYGNWRGINATKLSKKDSKIWATNQYSDQCSWALDDVLDDESPPDDFPARRTKAKTVWPGDSGSVGTVHLRTKITSELCPAQPQKIHYVSEARATYYIDGVQFSIGAVGSYKVFPVTLKRGQVLAIEATELFSFGVAVTIEEEDGSFTAPTGKGLWRVTKAADYKGVSGDWLLPDYKPCSWDFDDNVLDREIEINKFPSKSGAKLVWGPNARSSEAVFFRYRYGGEDCIF